MAAVAVTSAAAIWVAAISAAATWVAVTWVAVIWAAIIGQVAAAATGAAAAIRTLLMEAVETGTAITEIRMATTIIGMAMPTTWAYYNRHHRYYRYGRYYPYWYGGAYAYGYGYGNCAWLRRQALITNSPYWWNRYYSCTY